MNKKLAVVAFGGLVYCVYNMYTIGSKAIKDLCIEQKLRVLEEGLFDIHRVLTENEIARLNAKIEELEKQLESNSKKDQGE